MPLSTPELARIDAAYRAQQAQIQGQVAADVLRLWGLLRAVDITTQGSPAVEEFLSRSARLVLQGFARSRDISNPFYKVIRRGQLGPAAPDFEMPTVELPPIEQIRTSLYVTGVVGARKRLDAVAKAAPVAARARTRTPVEDDDEGDFGPPLIERQLDLLERGREAQTTKAMADSGRAAAGSAMKHSASGGREQVKEAAKADARATGWARVTRAKPCYFCAMLASRGAVYKNDSFDSSDARFEGPGTAKVHDSCQCSMRPVYTKNRAEWPEFNQAMHDLWNSGQMEGDMDTLLAWRRLYEGRQDGRIAKPRFRY